MTTVFRTARLLLVDPASLRAVDETEADWRHERAEAVSMSARVAVGLSAVGALFRALVLSSGRELATVPCGQVALRVAAVLIPLVVLLQSQQLGRLYWQLGGFRTAEAALWLAPQAIAVILPVAVFYAVARPTSRPVSPVGLGILIALTTFLNRGWLVPVFNQEFREMAFRAFGGGAGVTTNLVLVRGFLEMTFWEALFSDEARSWRIVADTLLLPLVAASTVPLAVGTAGLGRSGRLLTWCAFPVGFAFTLFLGGLLSWLLREWIGKGWWQHGIDSLATWIVLIAAQLGAALWMWRRLRGDQLHPRRQVNADRVPSL
jgi:hypothetical protein